MIAGPCGVNFKNDIEFFEAIYEKGKIVNFLEADDPEDKIVSLSTPFTTKIRRAHV